MASYAIIRVGGKQYRVREGERLLVDRLRSGEGDTFTPELLFVPDGDGKGVSVTAKVVGHVKGDKIRIGKYRKRTGYKRHTGFRASLTQIEIQSIGAGKAAAAAKPKAEPKPKAEAAPKPKVEAATAEPAGYAGLTVAQVKETASSWSRAEVEAALAYEQEHGKRKGAIAALESALAKEGEA
ncbi:MAG TPA: 50S ribosomal protein L21 [Gaiellaceae bacterium]|nr:50S ribosomal protein L21 [Gaiellaceae bacterium]